MSKDGGISRLQRRMNAIPTAIKEAVQPALLKSAQENAATMRQLVPVDEGDLKDSITVTPAGQTTPAYSQPGGSMTVPENAAAITVGNSKVRYAHLVEYGTNQSSAQPFFWPTIRLLKKRTKGRISRAMGKAVRDNWGSGK
jgi:HK97 gp10 family phage protein